MVVRKTIKRDAMMMAITTDMVIKEAIMATTKKTSIREEKTINTTKATNTKNTTTRDTTTTTAATPSKIIFNKISGGYKGKNDGYYDNGYNNGGYNGGGYNNGYNDKSKKIIKKRLL